LRLFRPDFDRRIDLPGAGPCPRPVDIDRSVTGFSRLVALRVYSFAQGVAIDGEAEGDEVFIVLMRGRADIAISSGGHPHGPFLLRDDGGMRAVYMPPHAAYRLSAIDDCDIAYARVQPRGTTFRDVRGFAPTSGRLDIVGHADGMDLALVTLDAGPDLGRLPERFVHVRSDNAFVATLCGERLGDWDSVAIDSGEAAVLDVQAGTADILIISASQQA